MDSIKKQVITALISTVFAFCLFLLTTSITQKRGDDTSIVKRVELVEKQKASKEDVVKAKNEAIEYTDKSIAEVNRDVDSHVNNLHKRLDDVISAQKQTNELLRELIKANK